MADCETSASSTRSDSTQQRRTVSARTKSTCGVVDVSVGDAYALEECVVTMEDAFGVVDRGCVYVRAGDITAVKDADPRVRSASRTLKTRSTIFPGAIELHKHLSYDVLPMCRVPRLVTHRV
jgi:imidazolonepropionase-like amidohydrolase